MRDGERKIKREEEGERESESKRAIGWEMVPTPEHKETGSPTPKHKETGPRPLSTQRRVPDP